MPISTQLLDLNALGVPGFTNSDAGLLAITYGLYCLVVSKGLAWVMWAYGCPLLIVNGFLVSVTYLQHTHPSLPRYVSSEWDGLRSCL